jgi:hypothetical protein
MFLPYVIDQVSQLYKPTNNEYKIVTQISKASSLFELNCTIRETQRFARRVAEETK